VLPIALFFVIELLLLVLNFMKIKQEKRDKQHALDMERIKQEQQAQLEAEKARIRAEILAEQAQKEKEEENK
jgi:Flp pilus assembly protein TadB